MTASKKILISGGGIGGLTLAYFLEQNGFNAVVVESASVFKHVGYLLALSRQIGQKVADKMGVLQQLRTLEVPLTHHRTFDEDGRLIMRVNVTPELLDDNSGLMLNRADLHSVLYDAVKDKVELRFGKTMSRVVPDETGVDVTFSDDSTDRFDLVIGADGVNSNTRKLVFGEGFDKYLGIAYFAFIVPNRTNAHVADPHDLVMVRGRDFLLAYHAIREALVGGYAFHHEAPYRADPPEKRRSALIERYGRYDATFSRILETLSDADPVFHGSFTQIVLSQWHKGRVCLIGDAACCPTPAAGVGASMAMAGAYILAKKLAAETDHRRAFADYDAYVRPFAAKAQRSAVTQAKFIVGKSPLPYRLTNAFLRVLPERLLIFLLNKVHTHRLEMPLD